MLTADFAVDLLPSRSGTPMCRYEFMVSDALATFVGVPPSHIRAVLSSLDCHYQSGRLPKADGSSRRLSIPDGQLAGLQSALAHRLRGLTEPSPIAACVKGRGPFWAARHHTRKKWVATADIKDFFPSVSRDVVLDALERAGVPLQAAPAAARLAVESGTLPQGAPSSPIIADLVLRDVDIRVLAYAKKLGICVTRYCDDYVMSGSSRESLEALVRFLERCLGALGLRLHRAKTSFVPRSERQVCHGLVVNDRVSTIKRSAKGGSTMSRKRIAIWVRRVERSGFRDRGEFEQLMGHLGLIGKCHPRLGAELKDRVRVAWKAKPC